LNIIFGIREAINLQKKYIVLELDTISIQGSSPIATFCVLETVPIEELATVEIFKKLHGDLILNYRNRNWDFCIQAMDHLCGAWGKQVDSFYEILRERILKYKENEPDANWNGVIPKNN
jgi:hypothetical protein